MCQRAQLGRASELELHALVEVKWAGGVVRLNPDHISFRRGLNKEERVDDFFRIAAFQQVLSIQSPCFDDVLIRKDLKKIGHPLLQRDIDGALDLQMETIEVI